MAWLGLACKQETGLLGGSSSLLEYLLSFFDIHTVIFIHNLGISQDELNYQHHAVRLAV